MAELPSVEIYLKDTDVFRGLLKIMHDVLEDGRVPADVKHNVRKKIKYLINKKEEDK